MSEKHDHAPGAPARSSIGLLDFLAQFPPWLAKGDHLWITLSVPIVILIVAYLLPLSLEARIRYSGLLLELAGIAAVGKGLRDTRRRFGKKSFLAAWWQKRPRWRRSARVVVGSGELVVAGALVRGDVTVGTSANATLEQRIHALEKNLEALRSSFHEHRREVESKLDKNANALEEERQKRSDEDLANRKLLEEAVAGGLTLETRGIVWLIFGVIFATASDDIALLLSIEETAAQAGAVLSSALGRFGSRRMAAASSCAG